MGDVLNQKIVLAGAPLLGRLRAAENFSLESLERLFGQPPRCPGSIYRVSLGPKRSRP